MTGKAGSLTSEYAQGRGADVEKSELRASEAIDGVAALNGDAVSALWRERVKGTMINPDTLLATDYLNHFNEAIMLLGMIADIPDIFPDLQQWQPKSYTDHFLTIGLDYGPLAAEAYAHVPSQYKIPFEATISQIEIGIQSAVKRISPLVEEQDADGLKELVQNTMPALTTLIGIAGGIISGGKESLAQEEIDNLP